MADIQLLPITPTAPSGDFAPSKLTEAGDGESFGQALNQAKSTVSEKKQAAERHEKKSLKKVERSPKKSLTPSEKSQKALPADMPKLPAVESPLSKVQELKVNTEAVGRIKETDKEIFPIPQISDKQTDIPASELIVWQTVSSDLTELPMVSQQTANFDSDEQSALDSDELPVDNQQMTDFDSDDLPAGTQLIANPDSVELPAKEEQTAKPDLIETHIIAQQVVNSDNEKVLSTPDLSTSANRAAAIAAVPAQKSTEKVIPDFMADDDSQTKATTASSLLNGGQQTEADEKLAEIPDIWHVPDGPGEYSISIERPNSGKEDIKIADSDQRTIPISDEALQTPKSRRAENTTPQTTIIPNKPQLTEAVDVRQVDDKSGLIDKPPDEKAISKATSNQRPQQQSSENMSLGEIKEALPAGITNVEVSEEIESDTEFQPRIQKDTAPIIAPRTAPLIIESALPKPNTGEVQVTTEKKTKDKDAPDIPTPKAITHTESAPKNESIQSRAARQADKTQAVQADTKTNLTAEKTVTDDQPIVSAVQSEAAPAKVMRASQVTAQITASATEIAPSKTSDIESQLKAVQSESDEVAAKVSEAPVIETETKNAAAKSERAAASNRPEMTAPPGKETQTNTQTATTNQTSQTAQAGSERHSGGQSGMNQNQAQNTFEADAIKDVRNLKNDEHSEFKAKFDSVMNPSAQSQQVSEAKAASSNTVSATQTENLFTTASTDFSVSATSQTSPTSQLSATSQRQFLPAQAPMAQLEGSVRWLLRADRKGAEIQLHPENLGKVTVQLRVEGAEVHARVWATEASTMPLLENHKAFLESSLKEQGLTLSSFDLQHGKNGQQAQSDPQNHHHQRFAPPMMESWNGTEFRQELPAQLTAQHADDGRVELYA